tara:strand:+ start:127053 stop:127481 length:429 start_codon:yes stop_codon:yes gene_type:complete
MSGRLFVVLLVFFSLPVRADTLTFSNAWIRATPPGAVTAAAYVDINNTGEDDTLLALQWEGTGQLEIHTIEHRDGMMRMLRQDALPVPSGQLTQLAPGAQHFMFVGLARGFAAGDSVSLILIFQQAGERKVSFPVVDAREQR